MSSTNTNADIVYLSVKGDTRKFVNKLTDGTEYTSLELNVETEITEMTNEFLFVIPSYQENVFPEVYDMAEIFFESGDNAKLCKGIIGIGNMNFDELYCVTAKDMSKMFDIPVVYKVEMQGSKVDVKNVREGLLN